MADAGLTHGDWLERVPQLLSECAEEWGLSLGEPYAQGAAGYALRAERAGELVVLKLIYPHREAEHEAEALRVWDGDGAVRLLDHDEERWAMLLERCEPGTLLARTDPDAALDVLIGLLPRLWKRADGCTFHTLAGEVAWWLGELPTEWERAGRPFERALFDHVMETLRALSGSQGEPVLLHQDIHTDNVLAAQREPWLVIDPKPLVGEREFNAAPIVRDYVLGHSRERVLQRLDRLSAELGLDRERALGWTIGQTVAWMFESTQLEKHLETVRWLLEARR